MMIDDQITRNTQQHNDVARHCMVVHAYYPLAETRVERQALALLDQGIEVDLICLQTPIEAGITTVNGVKIYRLPVRRHIGSGFFIQLFEYFIFFLLVFIRLTSLYHNRRYDVIQVHNLPDFLVFVALIPKLLGAKVILDLHDLMPEFYAERFQRSMESWPVRLIRWQESLSCRFADQVITVTELWRQALIERGQPPEKISVVMNVADDRVIHRDRNADMSKDGRVLKLIYHGTMAYRYGLDILLGAFDQVCRSVTDIHLIIHGGGEYRETVQKLINDFGLQEQVTLSTNFVTTGELVKIIETADLGIVPYRNGVFTDGILPTKLMEYAALGIPAIAARTPTIDAYFDDSMVEFFTPGDQQELAGCILKLYQDRDRLAEIANNVNKFNQRYNWPDQSTKYVQLIKGMVN